MPESGCSGHHAASNQEKKPRHDANKHRSSIKQPAVAQLTVRAEKKGKTCNPGSLVLGLDFLAVILYRVPVILAIVSASITWLAFPGVYRQETPCRAAEPKPAERAGFTNHLINESSPYLLQHAHNPVQWYPWGQEAFDRAKKEHKLIFLSIGYSTCYWCHVMERESFEDESVAKLLNDNFIAIKVDREERPELDEQYMLATELLIGRGGWPNSLWLTPDHKPFLAGGYFPKAPLNKC